MARHKKHTRKGSTHSKKAMKGKRRLKDDDEIHEDAKPGSREKLLHQDIDLDKPGGAQYYCLTCARYFQDEHSLAQHMKAKPHKKKLKRLQTQPFSQSESNRCAGMGSYIKPAKLKLEEQPTPSLAKNTIKVSQQNSPTMSYELKQNNNLSSAPLIVDPSVKNNEQQPNMDTSENLL